MEKLYILCPADQSAYLHMLEKVGPLLDESGISFHICRPAEDITGHILQDKEVTE